MASAPKSNDKVTPLVAVNFNLEYNQVLLLPYKEASQLVELLGIASSYYEPYTGIPKYTSHAPKGITLSPCDMDKLSMIKQCAAMGITLEAYKESLKDESE